MSQRRNRPNRYSDELLLGAAAEVFHAHGFRHASMNEIAARAGVTKPTLYARYGNKGDLYDRVLERIAESLTEDLAATYADLDTATAEDTMLASARAFFGWVQAHPTGFALLFADDHGAPTGIHHRERAIDRLTALLHRAGVEYLRPRGLAPGAYTELISACIVGVLQLGGAWAARHDAFERIDVAKLTSQFILYGLDRVAPAPLADLANRGART